MRNGWEWLRLLTPVLAGMTFLLLTQVYADVRELSNKLYQHQINADIHLPRSELVELKRDLKEFIKEVSQGHAP